MPLRRLAQANRFAGCSPDGSVTTSSRSALRRLGRGTAPRRAFREKRGGGCVGWDVAYAQHGGPETGGHLVNRRPRKAIPPKPNHLALAAKTSWLASTASTSSWTTQTARRTGQLTPTHRGSCSTGHAGPWRPWTASTGVAAARVMKHAVNGDRRPEPRMLRQLRGHPLRAGEPALRRNARRRHWKLSRGYNAPWKAFIIANLNASSIQADQQGGLMRPGAACQGFRLSCVDAWAMRPGGGAL